MSMMLKNNTTCQPYVKERFDNVHMCTWNINPMTNTIATHDVMSAWFCITNSWLNTGGLLVLLGLRIPMFSDLLSCRSLTFTTGFLEEVFGNLPTIHCTKNTHLKRRLWLDNSFYLSREPNMFDSAGKILWRLL